MMENQSGMRLKIEVKDYYQEWSGKAMDIPIH